jgi:hypothetical protein
MNTATAVEAAIDTAAAVNAATVAAAGTATTVDTAGAGVLEAANAALRAASSSPVMLDGRELDMSTTYHNPHLFILSNHKVSIHWFAGGEFVLFASPVFDTFRGYESMPLTAATFGADFRTVLHAGRGTEQAQGRRLKLRVDAAGCPTLYLGQYDPAQKQFTSIIGVVTLGPTTLVRALAMRLWVREHIERYAAVAGMVSGASEAPRPPATHTVYMRTPNGRGQTFDALLAMLSAVSARAPAPEPSPGGEAD